MMSRSGASQVSSSYHRVEQDLLQNGRIPVLVTITFGFFWSATYLFLGRLHDMWPMFNGEFPFVIARIFTSHVAHLSVLNGFILAFADGASVGLAGSLLLTLPARLAAAKR